MGLVTDFLQWSREHEWHAEPIPPVTLANGTCVEVWDTGVIVFTPAQANERDIILSCGVHGNETAPIEICAELITKLQTEQLETRSRVMFLIANPAAINLGQRFVVENMNRLFSGAHSKATNPANQVGLQERERAKKLEHYVQRFFTEVKGHNRERLHYDMHTAIRDSHHETFAIYPFQAERPYQKRQLQLLQAMGVPVVLLHDGPTTTFSYFSVKEFGAQAFTVELGKVRPFGENDMSRFQSVKTMLHDLLTDQLVLPVFKAEDILIYRVLRSINRSQADFALNFPDDVANFTSFPLGYPLARDGEDWYPVIAEGEAVVFPNANVALGQRAVLSVVPVEAAELNLV